VYSEYSLGSKLEEGEIVVQFQALARDRFKVSRPVLGIISLPFNGWSGFFFLFLVPPPPPEVKEPSPAGDFSCPCNAKVKHAKSYNSPMICRHGGQRNKFIFCCIGNAVNIILCTLSKRTLYYVITLFINPLSRL
jgi:hypothetical protein